MVANSKVNTADIEKIKGLCKNIIQEEQTLLGKRARAQFIEIQKYKKEIHNLFDKGGAWLSSYWMKVLIIFFVGYMGIITLYAALQ